MENTVKEFPVRSVTSGTKYYLFGYYGICPWDATGRYLLCLEVPFQDHPPEADDKATVGMVELSSGKFISLAETHAWNFQQGTMLHWLPKAPDSEIIFNDRRDGRFVSVILNVHTGKERVLSRAISAVSRKGDFALGLNFARLQVTRPGYGYAGLEDPFFEEVHPSEDGVYLVDLETGEDKLLVSMADVFAYHGKPSYLKGRKMWFNHILFNSDDSRFVFLSRWNPEGGGSRKTAMFTASPDGKDLRCLIDYGLVSHFDWRDSEYLLVWANIKDNGDKFYMVSDRTGEFEPFAEGVLTSDGHCSLFPNGRWVLTDVYPDRDNYQTLKLYSIEGGYEVVLGRYYSDTLFRGEIRCDLHPRWSRDGRQVCFDSVHEGRRKVYIVDVSRLSAPR